MTADLEEIIAQLVEEDLAFVDPATTTVGELREELAGRNIIATVALDVDVIVVDAEFIPMAGPQ
jgi:hypothetical protein